MDAVRATTAVGAEAAATWQSRGHSPARGNGSTTSASDVETWRRALDSSSYLSHNLDWCANSFLLPRDILNPAALYSMCLDRQGRRTQLAHNYWSRDGLRWAHVGRLACRRNPHHGETKSDDGRGLRRVTASNSTSVFPPGEYRSRHHIVQASEADDRPKVEAYACETDGRRR